MRPPIASLHPYICAPVRRASKSSIVSAISSPNAIHHFRLNHRQALATRLFQYPVSLSSVSKTPCARDSEFPCEMPRCIGGERILFLNRFGKMFRRTHPLPPADILWFTCRYRDALSALYCIDRIFGHQSVRRPFAAKNAHQAANAIKFDFMIANQLAGLPVSAHRYQRSQPGHSAQSLFTAQGNFEVWIQLPQQVIRFITLYRIRVSGVISSSVVPTSRRSCHGTANITRPSSVCGTSNASQPGKFLPRIAGARPCLGAFCWAERSSPARALYRRRSRLHLQIDLL